MHSIFYIEYKDIELNTNKKNQQLLHNTQSSKYQILRYVLPIF